MCPRVKGNVLAVPLTPISLLPAFSSEVSGGLRSSVRAVVSAGATLASVRRGVARSLSPALKSGVAQAVPAARGAT